MPRWTRDAVSLTATDDLLLAELPDLTGKIITHGLPHRMLGEPAWREPLCEMLGVVPVAEASAWLGEFRLPVLERIRARERGRIGTLSCRCGTPFTTPAEHGQIRSLARVDHGGLTAEVGRCEVCGRAWTFLSGAPATRTPYDGGW